MVPTQMIFSAAVAMVATSIALAVYRLGLAPSSPPPRLGHRGLRRHHALLLSPRFAAIEPSMRWVAGLFAWLPLGDARARADRRIAASGYWLGLLPDEYFALSVLGAAAGLALGWLVGAGDDPMPIAAGMVMGALWPRHRVAAEATRRRRQISRGLPPAIDLAALCLSAGMDFPGALRQVTDSAAIKDAVHEELRIVLQDSRARPHPARRAGVVRAAGRRR